MFGTKQAIANALDEKEARPTVAIKGEIAQIGGPRQTAMTTHALAGNTLQLPCAEARRLFEAGQVTLLYAIPTPHIEGTRELMHTDRHTEAGYPALAVTYSDRPAQDLSGFRPTPYDSAQGWARVALYDAAWLVNYLGDGTHCSELIPSPFHLVPGDTLTVENRYNVDPFTARVKDLAVTRVQSANTWMWQLTLERLSLET